LSSSLLPRGTCLGTVYNLNEIKGRSDPVHQDDEDAGSGSPSFGFNLDEVIKLEQQVLIPQLTDKVDDNYWLV
jgi:hypothetical protein